jgi:hypothetical protein
MERTMSNNVEHPGRVGVERVNDFENNGHPDPRDPKFRWGGPDINVAPRLARAHALNTALNAAAQARGAPLADFEREEIIARFQ